MSGALLRLRALFAGGPDTSCRTTWPEGVECVEVPMADLRAAFYGSCRYCRHPLTDDQERRWGICGTCHDDGTRNDG